VVSLLLPFPAGAAADDYAFDGKIPRRVLENYLSRAVTHAGLCACHPESTTKTLDDDIRMLKSIGAKFAGRAAFVWGLPLDEEAHFRRVKTSAEKVHTALPDMILQACVFEIVTTRAEKVPVPKWVFEEFRVPAVKRTFRYGAMLFDGGKYRNHWGKDRSVPDMSKLETRMWFYYRSRRYVDCGMEAIHFGQVMLMDDADPGHRHWIDLLARVRAYAKRKARRHMVLCDAHTHGEVEDGKLLFDFHSFPMRIREVKGQPMKAVLSAKQHGDIFTRSKGGVTPSGWSCTSLPYLVEFDNYGYSGKGGRSVGGIWVWGYDEICWFAHQEEKYRNQWLRYAWNWVKRTDPNGFLQMPCRRMLAAPVGGKVKMFKANRRSGACPDGFSVEDTIRELWRSEKKGD
jgi:hypothetical protein